MIILGESTVRALIEALEQFPGETLVGQFDDLAADGLPVVALQQDADGTLVIYTWEPGKGGT